jgi:hypothetical protein
MIPGVTCATCVFFSPPPFHSAFAGEHPRGQCRRHAPTIDRTDRGLRTIWPLVSDDGFCGEHMSVDTE